jgi:Flp pilus assembly protein TadD
LTMFVMAVLLGSAMWVPQSPAPPVRKIELLGELVTFTYSDDLVREVRSRGVEFVTDDEFLNRLSSSGASERLVSAVQQSKVEPGGETGAEIEAVASLSRCAEFERNGSKGDPLSECRHALDLLPADPIVLLALGFVEARRGRIDDAFLHVRNAVRLTPESSDAHRVLGEVYENDHEHKSSWKIAIREYREAVRLFPDNSIAHYDLGLLYGSSEANKAVAEMREFERINPTAAEPHFWTGTFLQEKDQTLDEALAEFAEATRLKPDYAEAHSYRAAIFARKKQFAVAIKEARKAVEIDPRSTPRRINLAFVLLDSGDLVSAVNELHEAIHWDPDNPVPFMHIANFLYDRGDLDGAIAALREGTQSAPGWPMLHEYLARLLEKQGDFTDSLAEYQATRKLTGDAPLLLKEIRQVQSKMKNAKPR